MINLNYCLKCTETIQPSIKPKNPYKLPKSLQKIHQMNKSINPKLSKFINHLISQKYSDHA